MFDGIIVGNISPGSGTVPTLQQVTDAGNETTDSISCNSVTVNTVSIFDAATARNMNVIADDYKMKVTDGVAGFVVDFSAASETLIQIKNNSGAILTDRSITKLSILGISSTTPTSCTIPHSYGLAPDMVLVVAKNNLAANFLGATTSGGIGGYQLNWDDGYVYIYISTPSPNDTDLMDFDLLFYFIPA
jgi:hypothetical protein